MSINGKLAVFSPQIGIRSETFVRRHMDDLLPGRTVVVSYDPGPPLGGHWTTKSPALLHNEKNRRHGLGRAVMQRLGLSDSSRRAAVKKFLLKHSVEAVLVEYLDHSVRWLELARELGLRYFAHAHGYDVSFNLRNPKWRAEYLKLDAAGGIITVSKYSRDRLIGLGLNGSKIHVVPCCVDVPESIRRTGSGDAIRCLAVGRVVAKKGPIFTLDAFRRAAKSDPRLRLDLIGEGELLPALRQFVHAFGLDNRVTLHGGQPAEFVQRLMEEADIFLHHGYTDPVEGDEEGLPVAVLEAMAHGLPVVSTRHAGIPEAVGHGVTGLLVSEGHSRAMADQIADLAGDADLRRRLGAAGRRRAELDFSWQTERTQLLRIMGFGSALAAEEKPVPSTPPLSAACEP